MKISSLVKWIAGIGSVAVGASGLYLFFGNKKDAQEAQNQKITPLYDDDGYDADGFNKYGYDRDGFDRDGYDRSGLNQDGYNRAGYKNGFDRSGHNRCGYLKTGYNDLGLDVSGKRTAFYFQEVGRMNDQITRAKKQMDIREFDYALNDIRVGIEIGVKNLIRHYLGEGKIHDNLYDNLSICKRYLPSNFYDRLQSARHHCSPTQHDTEERGNKNYNQVYFAWKTLEEFRDYLQSHLVTGAEVLG